MNQADYQDKYGKYTFRGKRKNEDIILLLRRHWLIIAVAFLPSVFFLLAIVALQMMIPNIFDLNDYPMLKEGFFLIQTVLLMFWWVLTFIIWVDFYLDVWIVTDQRIVNIEQIGLFRREVSELEHNKIQDVTTNVKGFFPTLLKFGYVHIQTAGSRTRFIFKQVPNPVFVRSVIMKLQEKSIVKQKKREGQILRGKV